MSVVLDRHSTIVVVAVLELLLLISNRNVHKLLSLGRCVEELNGSIDAAARVNMVHCLLDKGIFFEVTYCVNHLICDMILGLRY